MRGKFKGSLTLAVSAALLATSAWAKSESGHPLPGQAPPTVTAVTCTGLRKTEVVNSSDNYFTASATYVDVPDALVHFVTAKPGCVLVTFSAPTYVNSSSSIYMQIVRDTASACLPSGTSTNFISKDDLTSNSMTYLCPNVLAGKHTIRAQWLAYAGAATAELFGFTMTVAHR